MCSFAIGFFIHDLPLLAKRLSFIPASEFSFPIHLLTDPIVCRQIISFLQNILLIGRLERIAVMNHV